MSRILKLILLVLLGTNTIHLHATCGELHLLPYPQQIIMTENQKYRLTIPAVADIQIISRIVDEIPATPVLNQAEAYRLNVSPDSIVVESVTRQGAYWAKQTLNQLITQDNAGEFYIPCCEIIDYPAFRIRGFMHDVGRSYISINELKRQIALLSTFKINTFHWHLTENQAWRLQSDIFPQLTDSANFTRAKGKYYTKHEAKALAQFCKEHNVLLIPEIDMPGHSAAFVRAMGCDMQSEEGMKLLKMLMNEICTEVFPELPYIHIGTDEVEFTNPDFVPEMVKYIRSLGKKVISWNPGWKYDVGEIDMTQLWSYRGKAQTGIPAIDSRFHYINHYDVYGDMVALYNSRVCNAEKGTDDLAGSILAVWNDRLLSDENQITAQNNFYPAMLALAERAWMGGGSEYFDKKGVILPSDETDKSFQRFADFERRMLWQKEHALSGLPFTYVKQTNVKWLITDAFPNEGNLSAVFPPEIALMRKYIFKNAVYNVHPAAGAGIYLRHVWGNLVPAFYKNPQENHTAYAYTWVYSPKTQTAGMQIEFQNYSRSEADLPPMQGKWDYKGSRIWLNDREILPPVWSNSHKEKSNETLLGNENFTARQPVQVLLKKGWNKVLIKLPIGKFSTPEVRLQKWMFTCVFVTPDGKNAMPGIIYSPEKRRKDGNVEYNRPHDVLSI